MRGVQDVAIKELIGTTEYQHASFRKVLRLTYTHHTHAQHSLWHGAIPPTGMMPMPAHHVCKVTSVSGTVRHTHIGAYIHSQCSGMAPLPLPA